MKINLFSNIENRKKWFKFHHKMVKNLKFKQTLESFALPSARSFIETIPQCYSHGQNGFVCVYACWMLLTQSQSWKTRQEFQIDYYNLLWQLLWPRHFRHLNKDLQAKHAQSVTQKAGQLNFSANQQLDKNNLSFMIKQIWDQTLQISKYCKKI